MAATGAGRGERITWGAMAINDDDRRLLVVLRAPGEAPRLWGDPNDLLPGPISEAIGRERSF